MALVDGRGRSVAPVDAGARLISLVPSTTETLFALGVGPQVVGVTRFCVHPAEHLTGLPRIGGTKDVDPERVRALSPDLILGNCEENSREIFDALDPIAPVWAPFPRDVDDALADLEATGTLVGRPDDAWSLGKGIQAARDALHGARGTRTFRYAYLIWNNPWMSVSDDTFIASMLAEAGGINVFAGHADRFPVVSAAELTQADPHVVLLSSEPFPFKERHRQALCEATGLPEARVQFIDGELVSWHGVRMQQGLEMLAGWVGG